MACRLGFLFDSPSRRLWTVVKPRIRTDYVEALESLSKILINDIFDHIHTSRHANSETPSNLREAVDPSWKNSPPVENTQERPIADNRKNQPRSRDGRSNTSEYSYVNAELFDRG